MSSGNPFSALSSPAAAASPKSVASSRGMMFFDFETVPDEEKWPRPSEDSFPKPEYDPLATDIESLDVAGVYKQHSTAANLVAFLKSTTLSQQQLLEIRDHEKAMPKGNRATVLKAIDASLDAGAEGLEKWETDLSDAVAAWKKECSTNPFKAKICAFGWAIGTADEVSMTARTEQEEIAICEKFWELVANGRQRCGYNIFNFDDLLIAVRSLILGVAPSRPLQRKKFGNDQAVDLMVRLFPSGKAMKCKEVCRSLGIDPPAGDMEGSQVFDLYEAGDMETIAAYVESDVYVEREMYFKVSEVFAD